MPMLSLELLLVFFKLGLTSFGGPIAHIGYFRDEFVTRRRWLNDSTYTDLVALCQFLPGPASSQVGFSIGLMRAGYSGGLAAWTGFTLPSALAMVLFAYGVHALAGPIAVGLLHGLRLVAVAVVAQAVFGMARTLCPDRPRAFIAVVSALVMLCIGSSVIQIAVIALGGIAGFLLCRTSAHVHAAPLAARVSLGVAMASLGAFTVLLIGLPVWRSLGAPRGVTFFGAFYHCGALVFGGGHVVLPLLRDAFVETGWIDDRTFLAGYGAAQAVPGPLFSFAAYLGAVAKTSPHGVVGALVGIVGIFLPGMLLLLGILRFWSAVHARAGAVAAMRGINAAVVGLLGAALYNPLWTASVNTAADATAALIGFILLTLGHARPVLVVLLGAVAGIGLTQFQ